MNKRYLCIFEKDSEHLPLEFSASTREKAEQRCIDLARSSYEEDKLFDFVTLYRVVEIGSYDLKSFYAREDFKHLSERVKRGI